MRNRRKLWVILGVLVLIVIVGYLTVWLYTYRNLIKSAPDRELLYQSMMNIFGKRVLRLVGIMIGVMLIAVSSLVFQTITDNRILTPNVLGFDAIYVIIQTLLVVSTNAINIFIVNDYFNFILSTSIMVCAMLLMYKLILRKNKNNIILLLLMGMVISVLAGSFSNFLRAFVDPDTFQVISGLTTVDVHNVNTNLVLFTTPFMILIMILFIYQRRYYDVMVLGDSQSVGLGVEYNKKVNLSLIYIAIAVAISTALIGPLSFLGLVAVNIAREMFKTYKHLSLMIASSLVAIILVIGLQVIVELIGFQTSVTVLISLFGGAYMVYLILKENKL